MSATLEIAKRKNKMIKYSLNVSGQNVPRNTNNYDLYTIQE